MKAAILVELNAPLGRRRASRLPAQLAFGQVLVKVHYSGICGAQINEIDGAKGPDKFLPHLLGHEGCGTVLDDRRRACRRSRRATASCCTGGRAPASSRETPTYQLERQDA